MSWFNVIKTLQSKTGYAQLDFDNIVEEEETNCLKRLKEWNAKVHKYTVDGQEKKAGERFGKETRYSYSYKGDSIGVLQPSDEFPDIPEEVACALIEFIRGIKDYKYQKKEGSRILKYSFSLEEFDYEDDNSYVFLFFNVEGKIYRIFFVNTIEEKDKFKEWISSVV